MKRNAIGVEDAVLLDNKLWFILSDYKCLVSMDIDTKETNSYTIPSGGLYTQKRAYASMALVGRKIYLIPFYARTLFQFNVDVEEFAEVALDNTIIGNKLPLFMGVGVYHNYLFVMGVFAPVILRVNTHNNHVDYITDWQQDVETLIFDSGDAYFRKQSVVIGEKMYIPFCNANAVLEINCNNMGTIIHSMGEERQGYSGICFNGETLWFSPRKDGSMVKWNLVTNQVDTIQTQGLKEIGNTLSYAGVISSGDKVFLLPVVKRQVPCVAEDNIVELSGGYSFIQDNEVRSIWGEKNSGIITIIEKESGAQFETELGKVDIDIKKVLYESYNLVVENEMVDICEFVEYVRREE